MKSKVPSIRFARFARLGLALKIQYPGVSKSIGSDVDNMASLIRMSGMLPTSVDISDTLDEVKRQLRQEADYVKEFSENFAGIATALITQDPNNFRHWAERLGYLCADGSDHYAEFVREVMGMVCEPIRMEGSYDFGNSDLLAHARSIDINTIWALKDDYVVPSPKTTFLHRKLMGTFMILSRIRARIDVQDLIQPYLRELQPV